MVTALEIHLPLQELPQDIWEILVFSLPDFVLLSPSAVQKLSPRAVQKEITMRFLWGNLLSLFFQCLQAALSFLTEVEEK